MQRRRVGKNGKDHSGVVKKATKNDRQRWSEKQGERWRDREMETMRGETKQVAWVIAWGI